MKSFLLVLLAILILVIVVPITKTITFDAQIQAIDGVKCVVPVKTTYVINKLDFVNDFIDEKIYNFDLNTSQYKEDYLKNNVIIKLMVFSSKLKSHDIYTHSDTLLNALSLDLPSPINKYNKVKRIVLSEVKFDTWYINKINEFDNIKNENDKNKETVDKRYKELKESQLRLKFVDTTLNK